MFKKQEMSFVGQKNNNSSRFFSILLAFPICLMLLFAPSALYATEPIDLDPDPDTPPPTTSVVVEEGEERGLEHRLPPGHYVIIVLEEDGGQRSYEIRIR